MFGDLGERFSDMVGMLSGHVWEVWGMRLESRWVLWEAIPDALGDICRGKSSDQFTKTHLNETNNVKGNLHLRLINTARALSAKAFWRAFARMFGMVSEVFLVGC